jgi:hypothetical protein
MATICSEEKMPPPDAAEGPGKGPQQSDQLAVDRTRHNPTNCATCRGGVIPWTPRRRTQFAIDALTHGRRVCDLAVTAW